jgi:hypothetical protein
MVESEGKRRPERLRCQDSELGGRRHHVHDDKNGRRSCQAICGKGVWEGLCYLLLIEFAGLPGLKDAGPSRQVSARFGRSTDPSCFLSAVL